MGGIQDISPMLFPFCTKGFPKIMGEMIDIRGLEVLLRQIFGSCAKFVAILFFCRHYSNHFSQKNLECDDFRLTFAVANKLQRRVKAAAQQSSNKFDSAFALHFTCIEKVIKNKNSINN